MREIYNLNKFWDICIDNVYQLSIMNSSLKSLAWPKSIAVAIFLLLILVTVIGNMLVILAVLTTRRLRTVTNCFVMSLAVADLLVGIFVMPPAVALHVIGKYLHSGMYVFSSVMTLSNIKLGVRVLAKALLALCDNFIYNNFHMYGYCMNFFYLVNLCTLYMSFNQINLCLLKIIISTTFARTIQNVITCFYDS